MNLLSKINKTSEINIQNFKFKYLNAKNNIRIKNSNKIIGRRFLKLKKQEINNALDRIQKKDYNPFMEDCWGI